MEHEHENQFQTYIHDVITCAITCQTLHINREQDKWGCFEDAGRTRYISTVIYPKISSQAGK